jgi:hypothetical protein
MTDYTPEMAHAAVARGAAWLDEQCPDWFREINLERLNVTSPTFCVLGQTAKCLLGQKPDGHAMRDGYGAVLEHNQWQLHVIDLGFGAWGRASYEMLTIAWKLEIQRRLGLNA